MIFFKKLPVYVGSSSASKRFKAITLGDIDNGDDVFHAACSVGNYKDAMAVCGIGSNIRLDGPYGGVIDVLGGAFEGLAESKLIGRIVVEISA